MSILTLNEVHLRIIRAIHAAVRILQMNDELTVVGGLARFFTGAARRVGDVDVLIAKPLCERYWAFLEILSYHGIISVYDVIDRPDYPWKFCHPQVAHARALTADCTASMSGLTHAKLDICFAADDLDAIPHSNRWMRGANIEDLKSMDEATRARTILNEYQGFQEERRREERKIVKREKHPELGLWYAC